VQQVPDIITPDQLRELQEQDRQKAAPPADVPEFITPGQLAEMQERDRLMAVPEVITPEQLKDIQEGRILFPENPQQARDIYQSVGPSIYDRAVAAKMEPTVRDRDRIRERVEQAQQKQVTSSEPANPIRDFINTSIRSSPDVVMRAGQGAMQAMAAEVAKVEPNPEKRKIQQGNVDAIAAGRDKLKTALPVTDEYQQNLLGQIHTAFAEMPGQLAMAATTGPLSGIALSYQEQYEDAFQKTGDRKKAHEAGLNAAPAGVLDFASDAVLIGRWLKPLKGKVKLKDVGKALGTQFGLGGATEGAQQLWFNIEKKYLSGYDPDAKLTDDVLNSIIIGGLVEGTLAGGGAGVQVYATRNMPETIDGTVKEDPATIEAQMEWLVNGKRDAVIVPATDERISRWRPEPAETFQKLETSQGTIVYNQERYSRAEIADAIENNTIGRILGYGIEAKPEAAGNDQAAVTVRGPDGTEKQAVITTPEAAPGVIGAAERVAGPQDSINIENPAETVASRESAQTRVEAQKARLQQQYPGLTEGELNVLMRGKGQITENYRAADEADAYAASVEQSNQFFEEQKNQAREAREQDLQKRVTELRQELGDDSTAPATDQELKRLLGQRAVQRAQESDRQIKERRKRRKQFLTESPDESIADMAAAGEQDAQEELSRRFKGNEGAITAALEDAQERGAMFEEEAAQQDAEMAALEESSTNILDAIRTLGGLPTPNNSPDMTGELRDIQKFGKNSWTLFRKDARSLDRLAESLQEMGFTDIQTPADVVTAVDDHLRGARQVVTFDASRRKAVGPQTTYGREIASAVTDMTAEWDNAPEIRVVDTVEDLAGTPAGNEARMAKLAGDPIEGYYDPETSQVVVIAENVDSITRALEVVAHETVGHYGLQAMLGRDSDRYNRLMDAAWKNFSQKGMLEKRIRDASGYRTVTELAAAYGALNPEIALAQARLEEIGYQIEIDRDGKVSGLLKDKKANNPDAIKIFGQIRGQSALSDRQRRRLTEELLARVAERTPWQDSPGWFKKIIQALRVILSERFPGWQMSDADIQALLAQSRNFVESGNRVTSYDTDPILGYDSNPTRDSQTDWKFAFSRQNSGREKAGDNQKIPLLAFGKKHTPAAIRQRAIQKAANRTGLTRSDLQRLADQAIEYYEPESSEVEGVLVFDDHVIKVIDPKKFIKITDLSSLPDGTVQMEDSKGVDTTGIYERAEYLSYFNSGLNTEVIGEKQGRVLVKQDKVETEDLFALEDLLKNKKAVHVEAASRNLSKVADEASFVVQADNGALFFITDLRDDNAGRHSDGNAHTFDIIIKPLNRGDKDIPEIARAVRELKLDLKGEIAFARKKKISLPDVLIAESLRDVKKHSDYAAAKAGDIEAAYRLAKDVISPDYVDSVKELIGDETPIIVPVHAQEASGKNKIPVLAAVHLGEMIGLEVEQGIVQAQKVERSGQSGLDRVFAEVPFEGEVKPGQNYLLIDDTLTQGGTLADLADHIESRGGKVLGALALTGKEYSAKMQLSNELLSQLRAIHGNVESAFQRARGYDFSRLTESEARTLIKWKPASAVRDRILAAGSSGRSSEGQGTDSAGQSWGRYPLDYSRKKPRTQQKLENEIDEWTIKFEKARTHFERGLVKDKLDELRGKLAEELRKQGRGNEPHDQLVDGLEDVGALSIEESFLYGPRVPTIFGVARLDDIKKLNLSNIEKDIKRNAPGITRAYMGTADVLRKVPGLEFLGDAVAKHVDRAREYQAKYSVPFWRWNRKYGGKVKKQALKEFELYWGSLDNGHHQDATQLLNAASKAGREIIELWRSTAADMAVINQENELVVYDENKGEKGGFRPIGTVANFFPRTISAKWKKVIQDPARYSVEFAQLERSLINHGYIEPGRNSRRHAIAYMNQAFKSETAFDYFGSIEAARRLPLPNHIYDYSFDAARRYIMSWSERMAQIEAFGQKVGPNGKDLFDIAQMRATDNDTKEYIEGVRQRAYNVTPRTIAMRASQFFNNSITGMMIGNTASVGLNLLSGTGYNFTTMGFKASIRGLAELRSLQRLADEIDDAHERGVLADNLMNMVQDSEMLESTAVELSQKFSSFMLTGPENKVLRRGLQVATLGSIGGFDAAETFVRAHGLASAKAFLRAAKREWAKDIDSKASKEYIGWFQRNNFNVDALLTEKADGPETGKFYRGAVNISQGGYRYDQVPVYMDGPVGRFLFKYQKWGTQAARNFQINVIEPITNPGEYKGQPLPRDYKPLIRYMLVTAAVGLSMIELWEWLFGRVDHAPTIEEINQKFQDDELTEGLLMIAGRLFTAQIYAGAGGMIGNNLQAFWDFSSRMRFKNPLDPPALSPVKDSWDLLLRALEQRRLTKADLDDYLRNMFTGYRRIKSVSSRAAIAADIDWDWAQTEVALQDAYWLSSITRRYSREIGTGVKRRSMGTFGKTPNSPYYDAMNRALLRGDLPAARKVLKEYMAEVPPDRKKRAFMNIRQSVAGRRPIRVGGSAGTDREFAFKAWAKRNLSPGDYHRVEEIDRRYRSTAQQLQLLSPVGRLDDLDIQEIEERLSWRNR